MVRSDDKDVEVDSSIGVRQGSCESPVLFLFIKKAAMGTRVWPVPMLEFCARAQGEKHAERSKRKRGVTTFEL